MALKDYERYDPSEGMHVNSSAGAQPSAIDIEMSGQLEKPDLPAPACDCGG